MKIIRRLSLAAIAAASLPATAMAHPGHDLNGLAAGLSHPLLGLDHLLAMVAVGVWAAMQPTRRAWQGPALFMAMLAAGAGLGLGGLALPMVEPGIAASVVLLGLLVVGSAWVPAAASLSLIGVFALLHGHAHGAEAVAPVAAYVGGFLVASAALHAGGYVGGRLLAVTRYGTAAAGLSIAAAGLAMALG